MIDNYAKSLIRTLVPSGVGMLLAFLATFKVKTTPATKSALTVGLTGLFTAVYYAVVRVLEEMFPWVGLLLGSREKPIYGRKSGQLQKT